MTAGILATPAESTVAGPCHRLTEILLQQLGPNGHWQGELSSSALSTAVATVALGELDRQTGTTHHTSFVQAGLRWLAAHANRDGGWGDTTLSKSNLSTTALCWSAFGAANADNSYSEVAVAARKWLVANAGSLENLPAAIANRYGRDRTFSVPILMTLALANRLGPSAWKKIPALPFELAVLPRGFYGALRLPVVSYALPALIAIGQAIHHHAPSANPAARFIRQLSRNRTLELLSEIQPPNGGFLEATPLTAFVTMGMASAGNTHHVVARKAADFLRSSMRPDGSWPIDTNLSTWVTTLSVKALSHFSGALGIDQKRNLRAWLLAQQTKSIHPYTGAAPGAWAWTDLPGGVPDADDTAGALIALHFLGEKDARLLNAAEAGITWLLHVQNADGGIPTFCKGWGTLPFDRSTPEVTAHTLRAWAIWRPFLSAQLAARTQRAISRGLQYLQNVQRPDGAFIPLWFGNEQVNEEHNPVYGAAQVLIALSELSRAGIQVPPLLHSRAAGFLLEAQNANGGWGGEKGSPESIEETALALEALCDLDRDPRVNRAAGRLIELTESEGWKKASPIGLYFARLWYFERLYPLIFSVGALGRLASQNR